MDYHDLKTAVQSATVREILMLELTIKPGIGAGPIKLGTPRSVARNMLSDLGYELSSEHGNSDYFCENALQLEHEEDVIRFIGISEHPEINCVFGIHDVFDMDAKSLFKLFALNEEGALEVPPGDTCFFPSQGLNLWEADKQYDRKGGYTREVYAQIGLEEPAEN